MSLYFDQKMLKNMAIIIVNKVSINCALHISSMIIICFLKLLFIETNLDPYWLKDQSMIHIK